MKSLLSGDLAKTKREIYELNRKDRREQIWSMIAVWAFGFLAGFAVADMIWGILK